MQPLPVLQRGFAFREAPKGSLDQFKRERHRQNGLYISFG
jgi:hypothetical protein